MAISAPKLLPIESRLEKFRRRGMNTQFALWDVDAQQWVRYCQRCTGVVRHADGESVTCPRCGVTETFTPAPMFQRHRTSEEAERVIQQAAKALGWSENQIRVERMLGYLRRDSPPFTAVWDMDTQDWVRICQCGRRVGSTCPCGASWEPNEVDLRIRRGLQLSTLRWLQPPS